MFEGTHPELRSSAATWQIELTLARSQVASETPYEICPLLAGPLEPVTAKQPAQPGPGQRVSAARSDSAIPPTATPSKRAPASQRKASSRATPRHVGVAGGTSPPQTGSDVAAVADAALRDAQPPIGADTAAAATEAAADAARSCRGGAELPAASNTEGAETGAAVDTLQGAVTAAGCRTSAGDALDCSAGADPTPGPGGPPQANAEAPAVSGRTMHCHRAQRRRQSRHGGSC